MISFSHSQETKGIRLLDWCEKALVCGRSLPAGKFFGFGAFWRFKKPSETTWYRLSGGFADGKGISAPLLPKRLYREWILAKIGGWCFNFQLASGMELPMDVLKAGGFHVGVNFRGCDACVSEHFLDHSQVGAVFQKVGGEAVA